MNPPQHRSRIAPTNRRHEMTDKYEVRASPIEKQTSAFHQAELNQTAHNSKPEFCTKQTETYKDEISKNQIIRLKQLIKILSISRSCVYDWLNPRSPRYDPTFPKQVRLSGRSNGGAVGWRLVSVMAWIDSRDKNSIN